VAPSVSGYSAATGRRADSVTRIGLLMSVIAGTVERNAFRGGAEMQHDLPGGRHDEADSSETGGAGTTENPSSEQARQIRFLEEEVALLRRKLTDSPRQNRVLEQRLAEANERVS